MNKVMGLLNKVIDDDSGMTILQFLGLVIVCCVSMVVLFGVGLIFGMN